MKGIGVFHDEFARAHDAETRSDFITKFRLNLIEINRQLLVAAQLTPSDVGYDFFVGGTNAKFTFVSIVKAQKFGAVFFPTPGFLPEFGWLNGWHQDFQRSCAVHFFAHNGFDFSNHSQTQWHPVVQTRSQAANESGAQHELMAGNFSIIGCFFGGR